MKLFTLYKILIIQLVIVILSISSGFCWQGKSGMEAALLMKIHGARLNPRKALIGLGINAGQFIRCYPDMKHYLNGGLAELLQDDRLFSSADKYAQEMVKEKHFSRISLDGSTPEKRFQKFSYFSKFADESLGILLFRNYLSKDAAVDALYRNIIENEVKCKNNRDLIVFNPHFKDIGLSIKSGSLDIKGVKLNFYLAVVDLGADIVNQVEKKMVSDANLARISGSLNIAKMSPLKFDMDFYNLARKLATKRLDNLIKSADTADKGKFESKSSDMALVRTSKIWITKEKKTLGQAGQHLLSAILNQDKNHVFSERAALNPYHTSTGIALVTADSVFNGNNSFHIYIMAMVSGREQEPRQSFNLSGLLYIDKDKNGKYNSGEGYKTGFIIIKNDRGEKKTVITDSYGGFSINGLMPGRYFLQNGDVQNQIGFIQHKIIITNHNLFEFLDCEGALVKENN